MKCLVLFVCYLVLLVFVLGCINTRPTYKAKENYNTRLEQDLSGYNFLFGYMIEEEE